MSNDSEYSGDIDKFNDAYNKLIKYSYNVNSSSDDSKLSSMMKNDTTKDIIDIVSDFAWTNKVIGQSFNNNIPLIRVVERTQTYSSFISNFLNGIIGTGGSSLSKLSSILNSVTSINVNETTNSSAITTIQGLMNKISSNVQEIKNKNSNFQGILEPYSWMYFTQETGKGYVFPFLNDQDIFNTPTNSWGDNSQAKLPFGIDKISDALLKETGKLGTLSTSINEIQNILNNSVAGLQQTFLEKTKFYSYPANGESLKISFRLYNTVKPDLWKKHFRFLYLFSARNTPFRLSADTFRPPVLYDVFLEGGKRLPICSVENMNVKALGSIRKLKLDKINDNDIFDTDMYVNVPEGWEVEITFKSLISSSANLLLGNAFGTKILTKTSK